jgi:cytochrome c553
MIAPVNPATASARSVARLTPGHQRRKGNNRADHWLAGEEEGGIKGAETLLKMHYPAARATLAMRVTMRITAAGFLGIIARSGLGRIKHEYLTMKISRLIPFATACSLAVAAFPSHAADAGDAAAGKSKNAMCIGCHGIDGYKTVFPEVYHVPRIGGQHAAYIVKALQEYKSGNRSHPSMRAIAASLSDKDMADLAAYYASDAMKSAAK